jgi:segregation and condensation protein B
MPELRSILGALVFGANRSLSLGEIRKCLAEVAEEYGGDAAAFGRLKESEIAAAMEELAVETVKQRCGIVLREVAGGFRFESDASCGKWLRHLLDAGKPSRLSQPALETLAVIAYRQPVTKSTIEGIRGVTIDHVLKMLMEMQLVRIVGRSELPGRPFLYGTTQLFLEHFGLRGIDELEEIEPMLAREAVAAARKAPRAAPAATADAAPAVAEQPAPAETPAAVAEAPPSAPAENEQTAEPSRPGAEPDEGPEEEEEYEDDEDEYDEDEEDEEEEEDDESEGPAATDRRN